jgi:polysaccharide pyruvyl transferase WcaK-like protein
VAGRLESLTVRDRLSFDTLSRQGIASVIIPDLSESMTDLAQNERPILTDLLGLDPARPTVCLCLTAINPELSAFLLDSLAEAMASRPEIQFCFIPMSQHPTEERHNDLTFARQLQALWPDLRVLEGWFRPAEYLALIGQADAVVCSRFHSFLFAHRMHRPIIALPYSAKCDAWLEDHGMNSTPRMVGAIQDRLTELLSEKRAVAV